MKRIGIAGTIRRPARRSPGVSWFLRGLRDVEKKQRHAIHSLQKLLFFYTVSA
ncbi:hypothetical protein [Caballeronia arvi]|uniref:hypothetical protein n=1 Tax=Caballeronia arvi TaxID=1777135 RepID=UPI001358F50A|nr:hypothetical protein [Caballeronia arvi]